MDNHIPIQQLDTQFEHEQTNLIKCFQTKYNHNAKFIVKVPGRVNLVGEHVDYSGFPVVSMAIEQNISMAVGYVRSSEATSAELDQDPKLNFNQINLSNSDQDSYDDHSFNDTSSLDNLIKPKWYHYVVCGYKGILEETEEHFKKTNCLETVKQILNSYTINLLATGDIPASSGLSSSSALVVASSISFRYCLGLVLNESIQLGELADNCRTDVERILKIGKHEIASNCASYERFIGTEGGGIDQAIQMLAEQGAAKLIKFKPKLDASNVELPKDCEFFVLHCGKTLNKASTIHYNVRVFETRVAALLLKRYRLASSDKQSIDDVKEKILLSDFETTNDTNPYDDLVEQISNMFSESKGRFTVNEIQELLGADSLECLSEKIHFPLKSLNLIVEANGEQFKFNLLDRALHVYKEVNRVLKMQSIDSNETNDFKLNLVGQLLNESHQSLRELYECSCDELDRLIDLSNLNGAKGAKLTGAGWAGCLVSIVPSDKVDEYERNLSSHCKFMIKTRPNQGSIIYTIH